MPGNEAAATDLMSFLDASVTSSHAIARSVSILEGMGYTCRSEAGRWPSEGAEPFYVTRGSGSLVAVLPGRLPPWETGFRIAGAHTDYPGFRLKPHPVRKVEGGTVLGVEIYGSPNIPTWFDRDLMLAGTAWFRTGGQGVLEPGLFSLDMPLCRISMPAVHLSRGINEEGFTFNKEDNLCPYVGAVDFGAEDLEGMIAAASGRPGEAPAGYAASLADRQKASLGGPGGEMVFSGRIDNLAMCHAALAALRSAGTPDSTAVVCLFDHEEIGSSTSSGAASRLLDEILERICLPAGREGLFMAGHRSMLVSADAAHALNPCYAGKYDKIDRPVLNAGPVIKLNAQQRYSTSASSSAYFRGCAGAAGVCVQTFAGRNDIPCGSTIGPILSTRLGVQSVDVGSPILSMHSIREAAGVLDHSMMISALAAHLGGVVPLPAQV